MTTHLGQVETEASTKRFLVALLYTSLTFSKCPHALRSVADALDLTEVTLDVCPRAEIIFSIEGLNYICLRVQTHQVPKGFAAVIFATTAQLVRYMKTFELTKRKISPERKARLLRMVFIGSAVFLGGCIGYAWPGAAGDDLLAAARVSVLGAAAILIAGTLTG